MTAKDFVLAADALEIPEALDLTTAELNVMKAVSDNPFNLISIGFKCGFMRGQDAVTDDMKMSMKPVKDRAQKVHSTILAVACALDGIKENGCEPAQFVPALYGIALERVSLKRDIDIALGAEGKGGAR